MYSIRNRHIFANKYVLTAALGMVLTIIGFAFSGNIMHVSAAPANSIVIASSSSSNVIHPVNVPLPEHATRQDVAAVIADDGRKASRWRYSVADTNPGDVINFYRDNMSSNGWSFVSSSDDGQNGGQIRKYEQGNRTCYIRASTNIASSSNTTLIITVTN